jgi:hypothetical protein
MAIPLFKRTKFGLSKYATPPLIDMDTYADLEEDQPDTLSVDTAASPAGMSGSILPSRKSSLDYYEDVIRSRPELKRATGWKGVLQGIGDTFLNPQLMHPKYSRQMSEHEDRLRKAGDLLKIESENLRRGQSALKTEAELALRRRQEALANKQSEVAERQAETERRRLAKLDEPPSVLEPGKFYPKGTVANYEMAGEPKKVQERAPTEIELRLRAQAGDADAKAVLSGMLDDEMKKRSMRRGGGGSGGGGGRAMPPAQARMIEATKNTQLQNAERDALKELAAWDEVMNVAGKGVGTPARKTDPQGYEAAKREIYARLRQRKQQIQDNYEGQIAAVTGEPVTPFRYDGQGAPPPIPPVGAVSSGEEIPEEVRSQARVGQIIDGPTKSYRKMPDGTFQEVPRK